MGECGRKLRGPRLLGTSGGGKEAWGAGVSPIQLQAQRDRGVGEKTALVRAVVRDPWATAPPTRGTEQRLETFAVVTTQGKECYWQLAARGQGRCPAVYDPQTEDCLGIKVSRAKVEKHCLRDTRTWDPRGVYENGHSSDEWLSPHWRRCCACPLRVEEALALLFLHVVDEINKQSPSGSKRVNLINVK